MLNEMTESKMDSQKEANRELINIECGQQQEFQMGCDLVLQSQMSFEMKLEKILIQDYRNIEKQNQVQPDKDIQFRQENLRPAVIQQFINPDGEQKAPDNDFIQRYSQDLQNMKVQGDTKIKSIEEVKHGHIKKNSLRKPIFEELDIKLEDNSGKNKLTNLQQSGLLGRKRLYSKAKKDSQQCINDQSQSQMQRQDNRGKRDCKLSLKPQFEGVKNSETRTKLQIGSFIKQMLAYGYWQEDDIVLQNIKKYVSSQKLRTQIKKQKTLRLMKKQQVSNDYSSFVYDKNKHDKDLTGLLSKTYNGDHFRTLSAKEIDELADEIAIQLDFENNKKFKEEFKNSLFEDGIKYVFLYDTKTPTFIQNSSNSKSLNQRIVSKDHRLVGAASFKHICKERLNCMQVQSMYSKNHQKRNTKKVALALQVSLQNFRSHFINIQSKKKDEALFEKLGFNSTQACKDIQNLYNIQDEKNRKALLYISKEINRDLKERTPINHSEIFTKRAARSQATIEKYLREYVKPVKQIKKIIDMTIYDFAIMSDQAETPEWVFQKIIKFLLIRRNQLLDVFIYQINWNTREFYDGFKKEWPLENIIYANPPFSQALLALEKCMEFFAKGGNCVLLLPTLSIINHPLYNDYIQYCTVRDDLRLFPFKGYNDPLLKHIVILYFIQPNFQTELTEKKKFRAQNLIQFRPSASDQRLWCIKREAQLCGRTAKNYTDPDIQEMVELFSQGKSMYYITKYRHIRFYNLKRILIERLGEDAVEQRLAALLKRDQSSIQ